MFVSIKSPVKILAVTLALCVVGAVVLLCSRFVFDSPYDTAVCDGVQYSTLAKGEDGRRDFLSRIGLNADELYHSGVIYIPCEFNDTYAAYNELQKAQGLDLEKFKGKECTQYVYALKDCTVDGGAGYATMIIYKDRVIAGDISSFQTDGSQHTFFVK